MDGLSKTKRAGIAQALSARESQLRDEIRTELLQSSDQKYIDLAGSVHDLSDESVANELIDLENALIERHVHELREIEIARKRLADGTINRCRVCGAEIAFERLLVLPTAVRCVVCEGLREKTYAHEATPRL